MVDIRIYERFIALLENNIGIVLKISKAYTNTAQDREDLINDIALELWKSFSTFKGKSKASTWVYRVALNTALNFRRGARKSTDFISGAIDISDMERADEIDHDPLLDVLYECIAELDEFNKAIILLYLDGFRHEEIAEITGISRTNVGTRLSRIKEELRSYASLKQNDHGIG
jgi:RNA polymerase sigma-70 factor (ECF subfamily)